jgi:hypothetical protein
VSLISKVAAIATAGAAGGETFWASSLRLTTTTVSGESFGDSTNSACQYGEGGDIIQCITSNAEGNAENHYTAYIARLSPVDGSLVGSKKYTEDTPSNRNHKFRSRVPAFYHPSMNKVVASTTYWWNASTNAVVEQGAAIINTSNTLDTLLNGVFDNAAAGNGNYLVSYYTDTYRMHKYDPSTGSVSSGQSRKTDDITAFSLWSSTNNSGMVICGKYLNQSQRLIKVSQSTSGFGGAAATRDHPALTSSQPLENDHSNKSKLLDSNGYVYGYANVSNKAYIYQIYNSSLDTYKEIRHVNKSSYNSQSITQRAYYTSLIVVGDSLYQCTPIIFRKVGDSFNSVMYAIFQISTSTFQVTAGIGVMSDAGQEYVDSVPGCLESNVEETCLYLSYVHSKINSRGGESCKVLKLPLDLSLITNQNLSFNTTHDDIYIWNFWSGSTGGAYPVYSELFNTITYNGPSATYSRTVSIDTQADNTPSKVNSNTPGSVSFLSGTSEITV